MVKTVGRLPHIVYILIYDQQIVGHAVKVSGPQGAGPTFIEKIVQQELELPQPGRARLFAMLDQEISFIASQIPENGRWSTLVMDGIYQWVKRPRDVVRFANALIFAWPSLETELDPADLVVMEGLRLFEPQIFTWVRENRDFLFGEGRFIMAQDDAQAEVVAILKKEIPDHRYKSAINLLSTLFPQCLKAFKGSDAFGWAENYPDRVSRRGISTTQGYDAYFSLHVASDRISNKAMISFVAAMDDEATVDVTIKSYLEKKSSTGSCLIGDFIDELQLRFRSRSKPEPTAALLNALLRNGEAILSQNESRDFPRLSPASRFGFLIDDILEGWSIEEAGEHLVRAFQLQAAAPSVLADVYVDRGRELDVFERSGRTSDGPRITPEVFARLGEILLSRITEAAGDGTLVDAPAYYDIIRAWAHLVGNQAPRAWVEANMTTSAQFLIRLGRGMVSYSIGGRRKSYQMRDLPDSNIIDLNLLRNAATQHLSEATLSEDERDLLNELVRGSERFMSGATPPSEPVDEDDEDL